MKVLLPGNIDLDVTAPPGVELVVFDPAEPVPAEHTDAEVLVTWGQSAGQLRAEVARLTRLRWVQTLAAGPDAVLEAGFAREVVVTCGRGLHDLTVAEHAVTLLLAGVRRVADMVRAQDDRHWSRELGGLQPLHPTDRRTTLIGARVVIWGFGSIGRTIARYLSAMGVEVRGVARSSGERDGFPVSDDIDAELPHADALIMVLPATRETAAAMDARRLALLPDTAWLVNVGRGATLDEDALVAALRAGTLGGAALDVTATEPLPASSPLWDAPNTLISPHAAGGRPVGGSELISHNLAAYRQGAELREVVDR